MNARKALLLGASGLIGGHCLTLLLQDETYQEVLVLVRKPLALTHPKLTQHVVDFDRLSDHAAVFQAEDVFCCLGTTIKKAGSQAAFRKVDFTYAYEAAQLAVAQGIRQFLLVSSLGADANSSVFYSRVKGELEIAVTSLPFQAISIFQPSLLLGERAEFRWGERIAEPVAKALSFLLLGPLRKYRAIEARTVAAAMIRVAKSAVQGVTVYESDRIQKIGQD
ncbi:MAG: oxidoreductase [Blastocatellia bacterium]